MLYTWSHFTALNKSDLDVQQTETNLIHFASVLNRAYRRQLCKGKLNGTAMVTNFFHYNMALAFSISKNDTL